MGLFGGDKKKDKGEREPATERTGSNRRKSRRIVTPGQKGGGGGASEGQSGPGSAKVQHRARSSQNPAAQPRPQQPPQAKAPPPPPKAPPPPPAAPKKPAPSVRPEPIELEVGEAVGDDPQVVRPAVSKDQGKQPINFSDGEDLAFAGDLRSGKASEASGGRVSHTGDEPLREFLVDKANLLSPDQAQEALALAASDDVPLDVAAVRLDFLTEEQLVNALTQECWVPHLKVDKYEIRKKALDTIDEQDARYHSVLPVDKLGSILNLAMVNPLDAMAIQELEAKTGLDIKKVVATRSEIDQGIARYYGGSAEAKEGSMEIAQDRDSRRVTTMLSRVPSGSEPILPAKPAAEPAPVSDEPAKAPTVPANEDLIDDEIADIDDLLSGDEEVAPAIIEPITIDAADIEEEDDFEEPEVIEDVEVIEELEPPSNDALEPKGLAPVEEPEPSITAPTFHDPDPDPEPSIALPSFDDAEPEIARSESTAAEEEAEPAIAPALSEPPPAPVAPPAEPVAAAKPAKAERPAAPRGGFVDLVPVMEEEFQHAISHGKARIFQKWVSLQTRNRILNAVVVEEELDEVLACLYAEGEAIEVA